MGSKSKSSQSSTTNNTSLAQAVQGNNNAGIAHGDGNSFNTTTNNLVTDFGAVQEAMRTSRDGVVQASSIAREGLKQAGDTLQDTTRTVSAGLADMAELGKSALSDAALVTRAGFSDQAGLMRDLANYQYQAGERMTGDAMSLAKVVAMEGMGQSGEALRAAGDNQKALANGFQGMMQMYDQMSRSDDSTVAQTQIKYVSYVAAAVALALIAQRAKG